MAKRGPRRRIALIVEGKTEKELKSFLHRWLDSHLETLQLPRVGLDLVSLDGVGNFLKELPKKVQSHLSGRADFVVGLLDLYRLPDDCLRGATTVAEKIKRARTHIHNLVPKEFRSRFRQYFAVHETEPWVLPYPKPSWPANVHDQIKKHPPEKVNFDEPPAKFLKHLLGGQYKKVTQARLIFSKADPEVAYKTCPHLKILLDDMLELAKRLQ